MTISPLIPLLSAAAPAAGSAAIKAVEALGRLGESISFRSLFGEEAAPPAKESAKETPPATAKGSSLPQKLADLLASAGKSLAGALSRAGVDLSQPIDFEIDRAGDISLGGAHPQEAEIAATLANDPQALASLAEVLSALPSKPHANPAASLLESSRHPQLAQEHHPALSPHRGAASLRLAGGELSLQ